MKKLIKSKCMITCAVFCLTMLLSASAEEKKDIKSNYDECPLASDIALKYKEEIGEGRIEKVIKQQKSEALIEDLRVYAKNFTSWSTSELPVIKKDIDHQSQKELTPEEKRKRGVAQFKKEWYQGTEPIQKNGSIIVTEIQELANRRDTNASVYCKLIAESKLPSGIDKSTSTMIKNHYQNPAAEAWVTLSMPDGLFDDQQKAWLDDLIMSEKRQGQSGKKWAIEAAERMLRKLEKAASPSAGMSSETKNVRSE